MKKKLSILLFLILILTKCNSNKDEVMLYGVKTKTIKGLTSADIHANLTNKGFQLDKNINSESSTWTLKSSNSERDFIVIITGKDSYNIVSIQATVLNYSESKISDLSRYFLSYIASIPYENAQPDNAKKWIIDNIDKGGNINYGNARFELITNNERSRILNITGI